MHPPRSRSFCFLWLPLVLACHNADAPGGSVSSGGSVASFLPSSSSSDSDPPPTGTTATDTTPTTSTPTSTTGAPPGTSTGLTDGTGSTSTVDTGGDPASSTGAIPPPSCGDGHLDPGEQCDLGHVANSDTGACSLQCKLPTCGDGLVWAGKEACDHGPANNDVLYAGCTTQCQFGPRCNDGALQGPEECDLGPGNGTGESPPNGVPCDSGCRFQARLVFLSSAVYKGGELGGVEGAHIKCQTLAKQAKFDNATKFMAWISDAQHSPFQNFNHGPDTFGLPYVRPDGTRLANDWDDLILHGPGDGIIVTETGQLLLDEGVWTGTAPSGKPFDPLATCQSWSSSSATEKSRRGSSGVDKQQAAAWMQWKDNKYWTNYTSFACYLAYRVYCFEQ